MVKRPQLEDGYIRIANEIFDALAKTNINGESRRLLDFILRKTYGYNKKKDWISLSQFSTATGLSKPNVVRGLKVLIQRNIIIKNDNSIIKTDNEPKISYQFQKDYCKWINKPVVIKKDKALSAPITTVINPDNLALSILIPTKDNITKDNITKDILTKVSKGKKKSSPLNINTQSFIKTYCILYKRKYFSNPPINGKASGISQRIVKDLGLPKALKLIETYLSMNDSWFITKAHDLATFETNLNKVQVKHDTGKTITQRVAKEIDNKTSNQDAFSAFEKRRKNEMGDIPESDEIIDCEFSEFDND